MNLTQCNCLHSVGTPLLCKHPDFKPPKEKLQTITCVPLEKEPAEVQTGTPVFTEESTEMSFLEEEALSMHPPGKKPPRVEPKKKQQVSPDKVEQLLEELEDETQIIEIPLEDLLNANGEAPNLAEILEHAQEILQMRRQQEILHEAGTGKLGAEGDEKTEGVSHQEEEVSSPHAPPQHQNTHTHTPHRNQQEPPHSYQQEPPSNEPKQPTQQKRRPKSQFP